MTSKISCGGVRKPVLRRADDEPLTTPKFSQGLRFASLAEPVDLVEAVR
jgi:hypothetical protein